MSRKRDKAITIRATTEEAREIKARAVGSGCGLAQYIIKQSIEGKVYCVAGIPDVGRELKAIGNSINQIARLGNSAGAVGVAEIMEARRELESAWQLLKQLTHQEKG